MSSWYEKPLNSNDRERLPQLLTDQTSRIKEIMSELDRVKEQQLNAYASIIAAGAATCGWAVIFSIGRHKSENDTQSTLILTIISIGLIIVAAAIYILPVALLRSRRSQIRSKSLMKELGSVAEKLKMLIRLSSQFEEHMNYSFSTSLNMDFALLDAEAVLRQIHGRHIDNSI